MFKFRSQDLLFSPGGSLRQATLQETIKKTQKYSKESRKHKTITNAVTGFLCDGAPLNTVEKKSFRNLLGALDNNYVCPSRKFFRETAIPKAYNNMKSDILSELGKATAVSFTTDAWSSIVKEPFLSLSAHFVSEDWKLSMFCLQVLYLPEAHTGVNIAEAIESCLESWSIPKTIVTSITTDNATNMISAAAELGIQRVPCLGHVIHNAITHALKDDRISALLTMCRRIVSVFSHSFKMKKAFTTIQEKHKLPRKQLVGDVKTRWASKYQMMSRILEQEVAISELFSSGMWKLSVLV